MDNLNAVLKLRFWKEDKTEETRKIAQKEIISAIIADRKERKVNINNELNMYGSGYTKEILYILRDRLKEIDFQIKELQTALEMLK